MKKHKLVQRCIGFSLCLIMILSNTLISTNLAYGSSSNSPKLKSMPLGSKISNPKKNSKSTSLTQQLSTSKHKLGLTPTPFKLPKVKANKIMKNVSYPTYYDLRTLGKITPVKNQLDSGSCWAFATYGSLESNLLKTENRDFSENNLKNSSGFDIGSNDGGNAFMSTAYLARWAGPINESDDKFNPDSSKSPTELLAQKHIQEVLWLPDRTSHTDNNTIKDEIMKNGAIYTSLYYEDSSFNSSFNTYYDSWNYSGDNNHAVTIVGWDDNYDKNKFVDSYTGQVPTGNGAFIVKNSWGTSWGDIGYFYISYYDENIGIDSAVFNGSEPTTNYKNIYQYDPLGFNNAIGYGTESSWFSNVFTASSSEDLSAVGFNTIVPNTKYEVYTCSNYTSPSDLESARVFKGSGSISYAGYHTIKLSSVTPVTSGEKFAVIVKVTTPDLAYQIPVEEAISGYSSSASANSDQSFISDSGSNWEDLTTYNSTSNVCLKAFTKSTTTTPTTVLITFDSQGGSAVTNKTANYNSLITVPTPPTNTGYTFSGWYKEAGCINAWDFITDKVSIDTTLYAKWTITNYTVTFNSQGGSAITNKTAEYNSLITTPTEPTKTGYTFAGWYKEVGCINIWNFTINKVAANTTLYAKWTVATAPGIPNGLKAVSSSYNSINISWAQVAGTSKYEIYRATVSRGTYTLISATIATSYNNTGLTTNRIYYYKVRAYRMVGSVKMCSGYSTVVSSKPIPTIPTNFKATQINSKSIKLTWLGVTGANGYEVYRATSSTGTYSLLTRTTSLYYTNSSLITGKTYYYKMRSYRTVGTIKVYSGYSLTLSAVVKAPYAPSYSIWTSSQTEMNTSYVGFYLTNSGPTPLRIYSTGSGLWDNDYSIYDRNLQLVNPLTYQNITWTEFAAGSSGWVWFKAVGNPTWYDEKSMIYYEFTYDNVWYNGSASSYYGIHYSKK